MAFTQIYIYIYGAFNASGHGVHTFSGPATGGTQVQQDSASKGLDRTAGRAALRRTLASEPLETLEKSTVRLPLQDLFTMKKHVGLLIAECMYIMSIMCSS